MGPILACGKRKRPATAPILILRVVVLAFLIPVNRGILLTNKKGIDSVLGCVLKMEYTASMLLQYYYHIPAENEIRILAKMFLNILFKITD